MFIVCFTLASDPDPIQDFCIPKPITSPHHHSFSTNLPCKNSSELTTEDFIFSGFKTPGNFSETGLATVPVNPTTFPGLNTLGINEELLVKAFGLSLEQIGTLKKRFNPVMSNEH
ncbi:hypothetical protein Bca52824_085585 [Brassica carinata]|uniref:Uncharacterized protein n=1 Tax=Brassica carinata TaxID=52824 RepID=A0A8X7TL57_BRACI|nr:hypothetical protein Bca52824_085585 [Brassica carinata]